MEIKEVEVKPCPFCGGEPILLENIPMENENEHGEKEKVLCHVIGCKAAPCRGNAFLFAPCYPSIEDAIEAWNMRAD
jgi:Lar family restriction alleviation protein